MQQLTLNTNGEYSDAINKVATEIMQFTRILDICNPDAKVSIEKSMHNSYVELGKIVNQYLSK